MTIKCTVCHAANGDVGLLESKRENHNVEPDMRRVFEILDSGHVQWRYVDAFMRIGNAARSYGTPFKQEDLEILISNFYEAI